MTFANQHQNNLKGGTGMLMSMYFIGIDLSWKVSPPKEDRTFVVVLDEDRCIIEDALLTTDQDILHFVEGFTDGGCLIGLDAPLMVPPGLKQRKCERMLLSCGIGVFPGKREWFLSAFGGVRGEVLVKKFRGIGIPLKDHLPERDANALFEVYPYAAWNVLFRPESVPKYKNTGRERKIFGLEVLIQRIMSINPRIDHRKAREGQWLRNEISDLSTKELDQLGDRLDALIAAYTVLLYHSYGNAKCVVLGNLKEGFILTLADDRMNKFLGGSPDLIGK